MENCFDRRISIPGLCRPLERLLLSFKGTNSMQWDPKLCRKDFQKCQGGYAGQGSQLEISGDLKLGGIIKRMALLLLVRFDCKFCVHLPRELKHNKMNRDTDAHQGNEPAETTPLLAPAVPYSVFSKTQKRLIILTASLTSSFSPLSANIYYPALNSIAKDLRVSPSQINLTITTYMVCYCMMASSIVC